MKRGKLVKEVKKEEVGLKVQPPDLKLAPPLRVFLFSYFKKSIKETGDFPPKEDVMKIVGERYPASVFNKKGETHFSYYKSLYRSLDRLGALIEKA